MRTCPQCASVLPADAPEGLCARCLLGAGLDAPTEIPIEAADAQSAADLLGTRLRYVGDYELLEEIARGGMGVVFKARQCSLNRIVAVKMVLSGRLASVSEVKRFQIEAEAAARLRHPGIVGIHEVGEHEGTPYFSMDYIEGQNLAQRVEGKGPLPAQEAAAMLRAIAEAIQYAHEQGTLHRDLKPQNIVLDAQGQPHVTDFGLAKRLGVGQDMTRTGSLLGTPAYMPPEQATGQWKQVGPVSDVYALAAILYFTLTGRAPFSADDPVSLLRCVIEKLPERPGKVNPLVPADLENICLRALEKEPSRRYASAAELAQDLGRFLKGEPVGAHRPSLTTRTVGWFQRHSWVGTALLIVGVLLLAFLAYGLWEQTRFLTWQHANPGLKRTPGSLTKLVDKQGFFTYLLFMAFFFFFEGYIGRNYAELLRRQKYEGIMRLQMGVALIMMLVGLIWIGLGIRAYIWEAYSVQDLPMWSGVGAILVGAMIFMRARKDLRLTRLGQTPEEGFSPDEYQQLVELQWSRDASRARELARQALLKGDRAKALTFVRSAPLRYRFWKWYDPERELVKLEKELIGEGLLNQELPKSGKKNAT